jgi:hypothetical protein
MNKPTEHNDEIIYLHLSEPMGLEYVPEEKRAYVELHRMFTIYGPCFYCEGECRLDEHDVTQGTCTLAAPRIKYMVGWRFDRIEAYCKKKGWKVQWD